jgi:hypothetical protein
MPDLRTDVKTSFLTWLVNAEAEREASYRVYREYYDGDHETQLTERMRRYLQVKTNVDFRSNYCPIVVDALAERLEVTGFECAEQDDMLWDWWTAGRMDGMQGVVHLATVRDGDAYVLVEWDAVAQRPVFFFEPAFDGGEGIKIIYDEATNRPRLATKRWRIQSGPGAGYVRRMNVYYPERVEKFVSSDREFAGAWQPFQEDDAEWPLPWTRTGTADGEPLGLPVIHFRNKDQGYNYGQSELKDIVPLQDALNKTIIDLLAAADTTAFRIYWMVGDDPSGVQVAPGSWVYSTRPSSGEDSASMGYFPGEDLGNLIALKDSLAIEIARVSRTPVSYFQVSGQRPAEGTLKQEESGLTGKAKNRQVAFGNAWEDVMSLARRLWNVFSPGPELDETVVISTSWRDVETRNDKELLEALKIKAELGVPKKQVWVEMGYNAGDIERMEEMQQEADVRTGNLGEQLLAAFEKPPAARPAAGAPIEALIEAEPDANA